MQRRAIIDDGRWNITAIPEKWSRPLADTTPEMNVIVSDALVSLIRDHLNVIAKKIVCHVLASRLRLSLTPLKVFQVGTSGLAY
jgi:hypothetical protein